MQAKSKMHWSSDYDGNIKRVKQISTYEMLTTVHDHSQKVKVSSFMPAFRTGEKEILKSISTDTKVVVFLGGGV